MKENFKFFFKIFSLTSIYFIIVIFLSNINYNFQKEKKKLAKEKIKDEIIINIFNKSINNKELSELLYNEAKKRNLNPFLIYAIVKYNSNFDSNTIKIEDEKKYYGLFSLPETYLKNYYEKLLLRPKMNVYLGLNEIEKKQKIAKNNEIKLLALLYNKADYVDKKTLQIIDIIISEKKKIASEYNNFFKENEDVLRL